MTLSVLIVGGGIAGPVLAYWLHRAGYECILVERSPAPRLTGQQIDVRGEAVKVLKKMGLEETVRRGTIKEKGVTFVNRSGKRIAEFPSREDSKSFSAEIEILRGELARVFYEATKDDIQYYWGNHVTSLIEQDGVVVEFAKEGVPKTKFDLVVAADGMHSKTRGFVFDDKDAIYRLNQHIAYFTIPLAEEDTQWAIWQNAPGRRAIMWRPDLERNRTGAYLSYCGDGIPKDYYNRTIAEQKEMWEELFKDADGEGPRVLEGMHASDDFYMQEGGQVRMSKWSQGRVVLLGDSGFCAPGLGTSCAIVGAYILVGELKKHNNDYATAFTEYEQKMRPIVAEAQKLPPGAPGIVHPQSSWGIAIMNGLLGAVSWSGLANWFQGATVADIIDLPDYDM